MEKQSKDRYIALKFAVIVTFCVLFLISLVYVSANYDLDRQTIYLDTNRDAFQTAHDNKLYIRAFIGDVLFDKSTLLCNLNFRPTGDRVRDEIKMQVGGSNPDWVEQNKFKPLKNFHVSLTGNLSEYPYDKHVGRLSINFDDTEYEKSPLGFEIVSDRQDLDISQTFYTNEGSIDIHFVIERSAVTRFISGFIFGLNWILAISMFGTAVTYLFDGREMWAPLVNVFGVVIFMLPVIRTLQPGVPQIGIRQDAFGLIWQMILTCAGFVIVGLIFVFRRRVTDLPKEKKPPKPNDSSPKWDSSSKNSNAQKFDQNLKQDSAGQMQKDQGKPQFQSQPVDYGRSSGYQKSFDKQSVNQSQDNRGLGQDKPLPSGQKPSDNQRSQGWSSYNPFK